MNNILLTIKEFENASITSPIVQQTVDLARCLSSKVHVLHVVPASHQTPYNVDAELFRRGIADELRHEHKCLQQLTEEMREADVDARALLVKGPIINMILYEAERLAVNMIILGRHRHGPLYLKLMDNTDQGLIAKCECPVMFVPI
jgi:nucleotide-binding universal stress UspA family protein